jgi:protein-S-isoprenylcysteine O-methyltransferase Ste14
MKGGKMRVLMLPPIVLLACIAVMILLDWQVPVIELWGAPYSWLGYSLIVIELTIASWHARLFRRLGTNINTYGEAATLTREGLFRFTRNPMYLGFVMILLGVGICLGSTSPFVMVVGFILLTRYWYIDFEEKELYKKFGKSYLEYQQQVPRWF